MGGQGTHGVTDQGATGGDDGGSSGAGVGAWHDLSLDTSLWVGSGFSLDQLDRSFRES